LKKQNDIEQIFKEAFEHFEVDPGTQMWSNIKTQINTQPSSGVGQGTGAAGSGISASVGISILALVIGAVVLGGYFYFEKDSKFLKEQDQKIEQNSKNGFKASPESESVINSTNEKDQTQEVEKSFEKNHTAHPYSFGKNQSNVQRSNELQSDPLRGMSEVLNQKGNRFEPTENEIKVSEGQMPKETEPSYKEPSKVTSTTGGSVNTEKKEAESFIENNSGKKNGDEKEPDFEKSQAKQMAQNIFDKVPNVFTPNQDGFNDFFRVQVENVDRMEMRIFSRNQKEVANFNSTYESWDGRLPDGSLAPTGVYFYMLVLEINGEKFIDKGNLTLNR